MIQVCLGLGRNNYNYYTLHRRLSFSVARHTSDSDQGPAAGNQLSISPSLHNNNSNVWLIAPCSHVDSLPATPVIRLQISQENLVCLLQPSYLKHIAFLQYRSLALLT